MKENKSQYIILGLLNHEPMSGYDIKKRIELNINHFWEISYGQIYPTLRTLVDEKLVTVKKVHSVKGPNKKMYTITKRGQGHLQTWLEAATEKESTKYEILVKLFFGSALTKEQMLNMVQSFQDRYEPAIELFGKFEDSLKGIIDESPDHLHYLLTVMFGKKIYQAYVEWAQEAQTMINERKE